MEIITNQLVFFAFGIWGYVLGRTKLVKEEHTKLLSSLLVYMCMPCNVFETFSKHFNVEEITSRYTFVLAGVAVVLFTSLISIFLGKAITKDKYERCIYRYATVIPNYGYLCYPLAKALYGDEFLLLIMLFTLAFIVYNYTVGFHSMLKMDTSLKNLLNPVTIGIILGAIFGIFHIPVPEFVYKITSTSAGCMAPISMLIVGVVISSYDIKDILCQRNAYIMTGLRLIVIPFVIGFAIKPFVSPELLRVVVLVSAMPCGSNTVAFPRLVNENTKPGAAMVFISNILVCATLYICLQVICS